LQAMKPNRQKKK